MNLFQHIVLRFQEMWTYHIIDASPWEIEMTHLLELYDPLHFSVTVLFPVKKLDKPVRGSFPEIRSIS